MKIKLVLIFLLLVSKANCQTVEFTYFKDINEAANKLISKGIDSICVYQRWNEKSDPTHYFYIIWKEKGKSKIQKMTFNKSSKIKELDASEFWQTLITNFDVIKTEKYKDFEFIQNINGKDQIIPYVTERTNIFEFTVYIKTETINFSLDQFEIEEFDIYEGKKNVNINFNYNNNLKGKQVIDELQKLTSKI